MHMIALVRRIACVLALHVLALCVRAETTLPHFHLAQIKQPDTQEWETGSEHSCPPEGSIIAYIDRDGTEQRRYGRFLEDVLLPAIRAKGADPQALPEYVAMLAEFAESLRAKGLNVGAGDIVIHEQTVLKRLLTNRLVRPDLKADWESQLAVMHELQRQLCRR